MGGTAGTARGGTGHLGLTHTETQRGRLRTACGQRRVDSTNSQTTPATTSTSSIRQLLGAADAQTAHQAQPQHTNYWAPRTRKRHQQEHRPQRPTERSDPTQHAKGRTGDCPGPCKETTTRRKVTRGVLGGSRGGPLIQICIFLSQILGQCLWWVGGCLEAQPPPPPLLYERSLGVSGCAEVFGWAINGSGQLSSKMRRYAKRCGDLRVLRLLLFVIGPSHNPPPPSGRSAVS